MEKGDPKQLAVLSVVAVGAIGFLVTQLGGKAVAAAVQARTAASTAEAPKSNLRLAALTTDPFSHRKLAAADLSHVAANPFALAATQAKLRSTAPAGLGGELPLPPTGPLLPPVSASTKVAAHSETKKATDEASTEIALEAIAGASDTVAFLSVGGAESQPYRPNDRIRGGIRLLRVEDGAVVLSGPKGELTLDVGERKRI